VDVLVYHSEAQMLLLGMGQFSRPLNKMGYPGQHTPSGPVAAEA